MKRKIKKICHIQVIPKLSGVQQVSLDILENLSDNDFDKYIIFGGSYNFDEVLKKKLEECNVKIITNPYFKREICLDDVKAFFYFIKIFRQHKFDIVHTNSTKSGITARCAAWLARVPLVIHTIHGIAFHRFEKFHKRVFYYLIEAFCSLFSDVLTSVNKSYLKYYPFIHKKCCIYNGINPEIKFQSRIESECFIVGFMGRLDRQKDPMTLLKAIKHGYDLGEITQGNYKFILGGDGELYSDCSNFISDHVLSEVVSLSGWISDKAAFYSSINVLCLPSVYEAFGLVQLEAAMYGIPSISTNVEGIPEVITNNYNGFLIEPENHIELWNKIRFYRENFEVYSEHCNNALNNAVTHFPLDNMIEKYIEVYSAKDRK